MLVAGSQQSFLTRQASIHFNKWYSWTNTPLCKLYFLNYIIAAAQMLPLIFCSNLEPPFFCLLQYIADKRDENIPWHGVDEWALKVILRL